MSRHTDLSPILLALALTTALALGVAGCDRGGSNDGSGAGSGEGEAARGQEQAEEAEAQPLVIYSGRSEALVGPILERFENETGIDVRVNYGDTSQLAATVLEEGDGSPMDVFLAQDASTLALLEAQGALRALPDSVQGAVSAQFRSATGQWVGVTGRARVLAYNTASVAADAIPADIDVLTTPAWRGRVGWAPENASFQSFVSALIQLEGEERATAWVTAMQANEPRAYPNNSTMVAAIGRGEVDVGLTNHYYLYRLRDEHGADFPVENHYFRDASAAALVNVSGAAVGAHSDNTAVAEQLVTWMLSSEAQTMFSTSNFEFPLASNVAAAEHVPHIDTLSAPQVDLAALSQLDQTQRLLRTAGALP